MKKIFSALIILCMVLSMTAFADDSNGLLSIEADKETAKPGDVITYTVSISPTASNGSYAEYKELQSAVIVMGYPTDKISIESGTINSIFSSYSLKHIFTDVPNSKMFRIQINADISMDSLQTITAKTTLCTITAKVKEGVANGDKIELTGKTLTTVLSKTDDAAAAETLKGATVIDKVTVASKPVITLNAANAGDGIVKGEQVSYNETTGELKYKVTVETMPIGATAAYVVVNGDTDNKIAISGGVYEATYTADTTLTVAYDYDTASVFTYVVPDISAVYGTEPGIVAFGKGTIADGDEYGIIFGGEFDKAGKWTTTYNVGGIFAVEIADATTGTYTAKAFVNDAYGAELSITKE